MSKLDNIILECANKVLDGKQEKLGDYIDPTKQEIKDLIKEIYLDTEASRFTTREEFLRRIAEL